MENDNPMLSISRAVTTIKIAILQLSAAKSDVNEISYPSVGEKESSTANELQLTVSRI